MTQWNKADWALAMGKRGFHVFTLGDNDKLPRHKGWQAEATNDPAKIKSLWEKHPTANIGIFTSKYGNDNALMVVDVDMKAGRNGDATMKQLSDDGFAFPPTCYQMTPTGGKHIIYKTAKPLKQSAGKLGTGLDTRSRGGYIVAAGSTIDGKPYTWHKGDMAELPDWLLTKFTVNTEPLRLSVALSAEDKARAKANAAIYLTTAPIPLEGERNDTAFRVAAQIKDMGCDEIDCQDLMIGWNDALDAPLSEDELALVINSAYKNSQNDQGTKSSSAYGFGHEDKPQEEKIENPFDEFNKKFAFVVAGGGHHILWETTDERGKFRLVHLQEPTFHKMLAAQTMQIDKKIHPISKLWIAWEGCRRYEGLVFRPQQDIDPRFYNLWRGFAYEPLKAGEYIDPEWQIALDQFLEHAFVNVCARDEKLFKWLMAFFAHMVQRPWEKPLVALVFKGRKGVGKNALLERVGALFGSHFIVADDNRYLVSNFNVHLESCIFMVLDEACWGGDKATEGRLKGLITGSQHIIEPKGLEVYKVDNLTRVAVIGNERWLVPATEDERRYAVFNIGEGRMRDIEFFSSMKRRMEASGYRLLLTHLLKYDITGLQLNMAPMTQGLIDQKHASLDAFDQWWFDCLSEGTLVSAAATEVNMSEMGYAMFRNAFFNYARMRQIRSRLPDETTIKNTMAKLAPSLKLIRLADGSAIYKSPGLHALRRDWEKHIGMPLKWEGELECLT